MSQDMADSVYAEFVKCFNSGDIEGLLDLCEPAAVFVRGPDDYVSGREAIREPLHGFLDTGGKISFKTRHAI